MGTYIFWFVKHFFWNCSVFWNVFNLTVTVHTVSHTEDNMFTVFLLSVSMLKTIASAVTYIQSLYPGPISIWRLHQYWSSAKTSSSTAPMTMEPGLHTGGSKVESHWPMWQGSYCHLTRSSWPSHGCWWQMMTSTAAQWRILWAIWQACLSDWPSTVSETGLVMNHCANKS